MPPRAITASKFFERFEKIVRAALTYGAMGTSLTATTDIRKATPRDWRAFMRNTHRGFEKAQNSIVATLLDLSESDLPADSRDHFVRLLRCAADAIAVHLLTDEVFLVRRMILHDVPP